MLIRANLNINPDALQISQWAKHYAESIWLEKWRLNNLADLLSQLFGNNEN